MSSPVVQARAIEESHSNKKWTGLRLTISGGSNSVENNDKR